MISRSENCLVGTTKYSVALPIKICRCPNQILVVSTKVLSDLVRTAKLLFKQSKFGWYQHLIETARNLCSSKSNLIFFIPIKHSVGNNGLKRLEKKYLKCYTSNSEMYLNSEISFNSGEIYVDSSKVYLNLRKRMIKLWNSDIDLLKSDKFLLNSSYSLNLSTHRKNLFDSNKIFL